MMQGDRVSSGEEVTRVMDARPTHAYAQTNVQLFNQLSADGWSDADLTRLRRAYELAMRTCTGRFQASGKPLLAHLTGTASILHAVGANPEVVTAGLIHSVYMQGDFGDGERTISDARRDEVRRAVGEEVEKLVAGVARMPWDEETVPAIRDRLGELDETSRAAVVMRLADHLEHLLDLEPLYHGNPARRPALARVTPLSRDVAERLGLHALAAELDRWGRDAAAREIPEELRGASRAFTLAPRSHGTGMQLSVLARRAMRRRLRRLRSAVSGGGSAGAGARERATAD